MSDNLRLFERSTDPFGWNELFRGFDRIFKELDHDVPLSSYGYAPSALTEEDDKFVLRVDAPGVAASDVKVELHDGMLTVTAERPVNVPSGYAPRRRERSQLRFSRSFVLGDRVDPEKTVAEFKDGILTVSIGKSQASQKKSIPVRVS